MSDYIIISAGTKEQLVKRVNNRLNHGWVLCGGVSVVTVKATWGNCTSPPDEFFQAMVKQDGDK